jgi:hypothetical protein
MTKKELIDSLEGVDDNFEVTVNLVSYNDSRIDDNEIDCDIIKIVKNLTLKELQITVEPY